MTTTVGYAFDNRQREDQFACLERYLDPITAWRLAPPVVQEGDRCWEVGAGGGSVARLLAGAVGRRGLVVATDIDPAHIMPGDGVVVRTHDVRRDPPPEGGPFHLIHARLVLLHLPERRQVLRTLARALAPGGWLVVEEFDCTAGPCVLSAPDAAAEMLFTRVVDGLLAVLRRHGADLGWGMEVHGEMARIGLTDVETVMHAESWPGGSWGARLYEVNANQLQPALLDAGLDAGDLALFGRLMHDPRFVALSYPFVSTRGRRPTVRGRHAVTA
jgi:SAM-dependent methyltransferase